MNAEAQKTTARQVERRRYWDFLDQRIPELRKEGFPGRTARDEADREWAEKKRGGK